MHKLNCHLLIISLLLLLLVGCGQDAAEPSETVEAAALETPLFRSTLQTKHSGHCLDVPGGNTIQGQLFQQWACAEGNPNQQFSFHPVPGKADTYVIKNPKSGMCLDISRRVRSTVNPAAFVVHQWGCHGLANQQFKLKPYSDKTFSLVAQHDRKCVTVAKAKKDNGATLLEYSCRGWWQQRWRIAGLEIEPSPPPRTPVWREEFNRLDLNRWKLEHSTYGDGNRELQCYTPEQVSVRNGKLVLRAEKRTETCPNGSTRAVTSGMVRSKDWTFKPGQSIEWRVKLTPDDRAHQSGLWPALWSSGWAGSWPTGGEWDGFEVMTAADPKRVLHTIHYTKSNTQKGKTGKAIYLTRNFSDDWHTFRFDYGKNGVLVWYMDGREVQRVNNADTLQGWPAPFNAPMKQLKINLALGGSPGPLDNRALPATYEIDWVRVYNLD